MKNKKVVLPIVILAAVAVTITILAALSIGGYILYRSQRTPTQQPTAATQVEQPTDGEQIKKAFEELLTTLEPPLEPNEEFALGDIEIGEQGQWAFTDATLVNKETGELFVGEGTIILFRKVEGTWMAAFPGTKLYRAWIDEVPETLLPEDLKMFLR